MLAKVERGERSVTLEELLVLSIALGPDPSMFVGDRPDEWVVLSNEVTVKSGALVALLRGLNTRAADFRLNFMEPPPPEPAWPDLSPAHLKLAEVEALGEAEIKAADRLGVDALTVARAAHAVWGWSLSNERDHRVEDAAPQGSSARTVQAVRGHVTRELLKELEPVIAERTRKARKR